MIKYDILKNQFHEISISMERAAVIQCDGKWRGDNKPNYSSMGFIKNGTGTMIVNGQKMHPVQGQMYLLPAYMRQVFYNDGTQPYLKYYCYFNMKLHDIEVFDTIQLPYCVTAKEPKKVAGLFEKMIESYHEKSLTSLVKAKQYMMELVCYYMECCGEENINLQESVSDIAINKAIQYVEEHLDRNITVAEMAEIAGYHPSHFAILFQKRFGVSPAKFMMQKKAHCAMEQLAATSGTIGEISDFLGFSSQFYFCSFFKKHVGMTPSEYRQIHKINK